MPKVGVGSTAPRPVPLICLVSGEALVLLGGLWAALVVIFLAYYTGYGPVPNPAVRAGGSPGSSIVTSYSPRKGKIHKKKPVSPGLLTYSSVANPGCA